MRNKKINFEHFRHLQNGWDWFRLVLQFSTSFRLKWLFDLEISKNHLKQIFLFWLTFLILDGNYLVKLTFDLIFFIFNAHLQIFYSSNHCERVRQRDLDEDLEIVVRLMIIEKHMSLGEQISKLKTEKNHEHNNKSAMI